MIFFNISKVLQYFILGYIVYKLMYIALLFYFKYFQYVFVNGRCKIYVKDNQVSSIYK